MPFMELDGLRAELETVSAVRVTGRVAGVAGGLLRISGLADQAGMGDQIRVSCSDGRTLGGEVLQLAPDAVVMLPDAPVDGVSLGDRAFLTTAGEIAPSDNWIGRVIDPYGRPLDGEPLLRGPVIRTLRAQPPDAASRRPLGDRLDTGMSVFNTLLPIVRGQRLGLFAGSGRRKVQPDCTSGQAHGCRCCRAGADW